MKKISFIFLLITSISGYSQITPTKLTKKELIKIITKDACDELSKKDYSNLSQSELQSELGMAMIPSITSHVDDITNLYGDITNQSVMQKVGMEVGLELFSSCPKFTEISMALAKKQTTTTNTTTKKTPPLLAPSNSLTDQVTMLSVNPGDISHILVKNKLGKTEKFYWLEYFENADEIVTKQKNYINKKINIAYTEKQVYDAAKKNYKTIKVIESINL